jgi:predicted SAM-dependent methyltransferase
MTEIIELGGGNNPQFHPNVDSRAGLNVDIVADFNKPLDMIESDKYDIVYSRYSIEHISWRNVKQFIKEIYRIAAPLGLVFIQTANLYEQCKRAVEEESKGNWEMVSCMIFGDLDYPENSHKCGFSPSYMTKLFQEVGFLSISVTPLDGCPTDLILQAQKPETVQLYVPVSEVFEK